MKFDPEPAERLNCPPLNPPRLTSYGVVMSDELTCASRGMFELPKLEPLSVVEFWSAERPSTENPAGSPSAPVTGVTPGIEAAIALRSPCCPAATAAASVRISVPLMSPGLSPRVMRARSATAFIVSSSTMRESRASATRISWSAVRFTSNRLGAKPIAVTLTK